jgi:hypothetical protein
MDFRKAGRAISIARTNIGRIIIPIDALLRQLKYKKKCDTFQKLEEAVKALVQQYDRLSTTLPPSWMRTHLCWSMGSLTSWTPLSGTHRFYNVSCNSVMLLFLSRVMPLPAICWQRLFRCSCLASFTHYMCTESLACFMIWNPALNMPDKDMNERELAKLDNPFNAKTKMSADKRKEKEKQKEKASAVWEQSIEACNESQKGSAASVVVPQTKRRLNVRSICLSVVKNN